MTEAEQQRIADIRIADHLRSSAVLGGTVHWPAEYVHRVSELVDRQERELTGVRGALGDTHLVEVLHIALLDLMGECPAGADTNLCSALAARLQHDLELPR